ncbi:hypothetical protein YC2023_014229 [Brassica napus]
MERKLTKTQKATPKKRFARSDVNTSEEEGCLRSLLAYWLALDLLGALLVYGLQLLREHRILLHSLRIQHQQSIPLALQLRRGSKQKMKPRHVNTCDIKRVLEETEEEAKTCIHM